MSEGRTVLASRALHISSFVLNHCVLLMATMVSSDEELHHLTTGLRPPFSRAYKGVSRCFGCGKLSLFPDLSFCHGSYHQVRKSKCAQGYVLDENGQELAHGETVQMLSAKALHLRVMEGDSAI